MSIYDVQSVSDSFDNDFGDSTNHLTVHDYSSNLLHPSEVTNLDFGMGTGSHAILDYQDPLKHAYKHEFSPFTLDLGETHFVQPHEVKSYYRNDGTYVEGYYRDGDGNTSINRSVDQGGGYLSSNPDGDPLNNLK